MSWAAGSDWPLALLVLLLGPAAGSFLGVVVDRWCTGRGLWGRSACETCAARLGWRDLVPVLSGLRGRCRHCGAPIPAHLLRIELAATGAGVLAVLLADSAAEAAALAVFLWCLVGLFYADLLHLRLPDPLNAGLLAAGLALAAAAPGRGVGEALLSAGAGAGAFWLIRAGYRALRGREGLGLGDVKMMAGLGAGLGWMLLPLATLIAALLALAVVGLEALRTQRAPDTRAPLPFGACLAGAAVLVLLV